MVKILSFLLFGLLLYNMMGYSVVYLLEEKRTVSAANQEYIETQPYSRDIVIKIPVSLPYQTSWANPETAEGKIRHLGEYYQMKTKQLINDTMYVHCEFDQNARDRFMALVSHINEITGTDSDRHKQSPSTIFKSLLKEYMSSTRKHVFFLMEICVVPAGAADQYNCNFIDTYPSIPSPPPDQV